MAKSASTNVYILLGGTADISDRIRTATLSTSYETIDLTTMGSDAYERLAGLQDYTLAITLAQDFAAANVDSMIWTFYDAGAGIALLMTFAGSTVGAANPSFAGTVLIDQYTPVDASVGEGHEVSLNAVCSGGTKLVRATS